MQIVVSIGAVRASPQLGEMLPPFLTVVSCPYLFTALRGMRTRSSDENSVRLSVKRVHCIVTKLKKAMFRLLYHTKEHLF